MNGANGRNTARRRRADTIARCERIMETAGRLPLTRDVLAEAIERATPAQLDLMEGWLDAEIESRERSKRARLLKAAGFPNAKDIEGYDWSNLRMPADWGRAQLETLDFVDRCEDLVLYGVYGQINVYGVTTKSERHKRSYWTRTADGNGIGGRKAPVPYGSRWIPGCQRPTHGPREERNDDTGACPTEYQAARDERPDAYADS